MRGLGLTALVQADGTHLQYVTDGHGDVTKLISGSGAVEADYTYDAFGNQTEEAEDVNPFRYAGEYWDSESGLIYLRARYYDSGVGGFISEDPARDGENWYVYCGGNPVMFVDPSGLTYFDSFNEEIQRHTEVMEKFRFEFSMAWATTESPITVVENDDNITIYAYVNIVGEAADTIIPGSNPPPTYRQAAIGGIKTSWSGEYNGKSVNVAIMDVGDGNKHYIKDGQKSLKITINNGNGVSNLSGWVSKGSPGRITMYQGDNRNNYTYTQDDFSRTVGHEFGHALGIADLYNDYGIATKFPSIMNSQWEVNGAQAVDYAMMMRAQTTNRWQTWRGNTKLLDEMGIIYK